MLQSKDQLNQERGAGRTFGGFDEEDIEFPPTYRFKVGTRDYNPDKGRVPSWCDRVLHRVTPDSDLRQTSYGCVNTLLGSDHSPVFATYEMMIRRPNLPLPSVPSTKYVDCFVNG